MKGGLSSKKVKNPYSEEAKKNFSCRVCRKTIPNEYFEVTLAEPQTKFNVCGNNCESTLYGILSEIIKDKNEFMIKC